MSIEEAMVFILSSEGYGMSAETLAAKISRQGLYTRRDGMPVNTKQIWAAFFRHPEEFVRDGRLIRLII